MISQRVRTVVILVVTAIWAGNFIAGITVSGYISDPAIHAVFMSIVGGLLAISVREKNGNGNGDNGSKS